MQVTCIACIFNQVQESWFYTFIIWFLLIKLFFYWIMNKVFSSELYLFEFLFESPSFQIRWDIYYLRKTRKWNI